MIIIDYSFIFKWLDWILYSSSFEIKKVNFVMGYIRIFAFIFKRKLRYILKLNKLFKIEKIS